MSRQARPAILGGMPPTATPLPPRNALAGATDTAAAPAVLRKVARATFAWVVVFAAFHLYWALGGRFGFGHAQTTVPKQRNAVSWAFSVVVIGMFAVGTALPLALYQDWGRRIPARPLSWCCWAGGALLALRGLSGLLDTSLRGTGLADRGLTGLSYQQELGVAHPDAYTLWSGSTVDAYFTLGGLLFLAAALTHRRARRSLHT